MAPTDPSATTRSGCPARRRPGCRHGGHHREHRRHEPSPRRALRTPTVPMPDHRASPGTLRRVEKRGWDLTSCRSWDPVGPGGSEIPDDLAIPLPMTADGRGPEALLRHAAEGGFWSAVVVWCGPPSVAEVLEGQVRRPGSASFQAIPARERGTMGMRAAGALIPGRAISHRAPSLGRGSGTRAGRPDGEPVDDGRDANPLGHRAG